jgi:hypothetical protein
MLCCEPVDTRWNRGYGSVDHEHGRSAIAITKRAPLETILPELKIGNDLTDKVTKAERRTPPPKQTRKSRENLHGNPCRIGLLYGNPD